MRGIWVGILIVLCAACPAIAVHAHPLDGQCEIPPVEIIPAPGDPSILIQEPQDGATVYGSPIDVVVKIEKVDLSQGGHWDVFVNDIWAGEVHGEGAALTLEEGEHTICVVLYDEAGTAIDLHDGIRLTVKRASERYPAQQSRFAPPQLVEAASEAASPIALAAALLAAGIGGWGVGRVFGRRRKHKQS
jgi:hypothetical protein